MTISFSCPAHPHPSIPLTFLHFFPQGPHAAVGDVRPVSGHEAGEPGVSATAANLRRVPLHEGPFASQHR